MFLTFLPTAPLRDCLAEPCGPNSGHLWLGGLHSSTSESLAGPRKPNSGHRTFLSFYHFFNSAGKSKLFKIRGQQGFGKLPTAGVRVPTKGDKLPGITSKKLKLEICCTTKFRTQTRNSWPRRDAPENWDVTIQEEPRRRAPLRDHPRS